MKPAFAGRRNLSSRCTSSTHPLEEHDRIMQLRRGLYFIAAPYQKQRPHPFLVANRLLQPSYVSMQSALALPA
ncbi:MAG: hypothetical protein R2854_01360 [Caldilineaceae bacterium]